MTSAGGLKPALLIGVDGPEVGCDECFELIDRYVEAQRAGADVAAAFPGMGQHLLCCPACAEEAVSLLGLLEEPSSVRPPRVY